MSNRKRLRYLGFGIVFGAMLAWMAIVIPGCGTVKGFASDLHYVADGLGQAMTEQRRNGID